MSKYPSTFYRVSLKAVIRNEDNNVLVTKEGDYVWSFPGGGMEHGETEYETLAREMEEEAYITAPFIARPLGADTVFVDHLNTWVLWIFYEVTFPEGLSYSAGKDVWEIEFKDPKLFEDSSNKWEQLVYKWANKTPQ